MNRDTVITISRQHGSGGGEIGRRLADQMGVPFYDKAVLKEFAVENGLGNALLESYGEKHASSLLYSLATSTYSFGYYDASKESPISQKALLTAFETIKTVARRGPCVIVGRCADYVLRDRENLLSVFIHAPLQKRVGLVAQRENLTGEEAEESIRVIDRLRRNYYNYYTSKSWGEVDSYHLSVDSSLLGMETTADMLRQIALAGAECGAGPVNPLLRSVEGMERAV